MSYSSHFNVTEAPPDAIFNLTTKYKKDSDSKKLNLGVGAYRTAESQPYVLQVVKKTEGILLQQNHNKEYLPIDGYKPFLDAASTLLLGADSEAIDEKRVCAVQSVGGTGAVRLAAEYIKRHLPKNTKVYIPNPTWGNHKKIFTHASVPFSEYRYYNYDTNCMDIEGCIEDIKNAPKRSVILLHACAHNPTGLDPSREHWILIRNAIIENEHLAFFDCAYQGFASGNMEHDAEAIRIFVREGLECFVAQSFSKNLGFYSERLGCLLAVTATRKQAHCVKSQIKQIIRAMYSNPPSHGALVAATIMTTPTLFIEWEHELRIMSARLTEMRQLLYEELVKIKVPGNWDHIQTQIGMFTFLGLDKLQVQRLVNTYHIYLTSNGRISVAGLSPITIPYLANAIKDVVSTTPAKL